MTDPNANTLEKASDLGKTPEAVATYSYRANLLGMAGGMETIDRLAA